MEHLLTRPVITGLCYEPPPRHDVKADQIVPTDDERNLDLGCLFAEARANPGGPV
jgi:hypothetical protein